MFDVTANLHRRLGSDHVDPNTIGCERPMYASHNYVVLLQLLNDEAENSVYWMQECLKDISVCDAAALFGDVYASYLGYRGPLLRCVVSLA